MRNTLNDVLFLANLLAQGPRLGMDAVSLAQTTGSAMGQIGRGERVSPFMETFGPLQARNQAELERRLPIFKALREGAARVTEADPSMQLMEFLPPGGPIRKGVKSAAKAARKGKLIASDVFNARRGRSGNGFEAGRPAFFADKPRTAEFGKKVTRADLYAEKPFTFSETEIDDVVSLVPEKTARKVLLASEGYDDTARDAAEFLLESGDENFSDALARILGADDRQVWQSPEIIKAIRKSGYDAVVTVDAFGGKPEFVVFEPSQIVEKGLSDPHTAGLREALVEVIKEGGK